MLQKPVRYQVLEVLANANAGLSVVVVVVVVVVVGGDADWGRAVTSVHC